MVRVRIKEEEEDRFTPTMILSQEVVEMEAVANTVDTVTGTSEEEAYDNT